MSQEPEAEISINSQGCRGKGGGENNGTPEQNQLKKPGVSAALQ